MWVVILAMTAGLVVGQNEVDTGGKAKSDGKATEDDLKDLIKKNNLDLS